ncbi:hypothetical protein [Glycomyces sp. MUSA5-2]|uniref:hypothetical protein n=1 Tax=Glycomyces sp. MUSA5-2 TaxID=2053002 RepID=UPI00300B8F50
MNPSDSVQVSIGETVIDGQRIEFVWAPGTTFVTAQFTAVSPRGIANLTGIGTMQPHVVPLSHKGWLTPERATALAECGRSCFADVVRDPGPGEVRGSPEGARRAAADDSNAAGAGLFNRRRTPARTR